MDRLGDKVCSAVVDLTGQFSKVVVPFPARTSNVWCCFITSPGFGGTILFNFSHFVGYVVIQSQCNFNLHSFGDRESLATFPGSLAIVKYLLPILLLGGLSFFYGFVVLGISCLWPLWHKCFANNFFQSILCFSHFLNGVFGWT